MSEWYGQPRQSNFAVIKLIFSRVRLYKFSEKMALSCWFISLSMTTSLIHCNMIAVKIERTDNLTKAKTIYCNSVER